MRCRQCQDQFKPSRKWQLFCSTKCKHYFNKITKGICFYCGELGNHRDHIHPVSARIGKRIFGANQETVCACAECNSTLGDNIFESVEYRVKYLIDKYSKKYHKELTTIQWDDEDMAELGPTLRTTIRAALAVRRQVEERLKYLHNVRIKLNRLINDLYLEEDDLPEIDEMGNPNGKW